MKISLTGGDALYRSGLASSQRTLNLYAESIAVDLGEPTPSSAGPSQAPVTHYPTPGLKRLGGTPDGKPIRGLYRASNGDLYAVAGLSVYYIDTKWVFNLVGTMSMASLNPTKMADNGTTIILCDGTTTNGYAINMAARLGLKNLFDPAASDEFTGSSTGWLGSTFVDFSDTYLIANSIGTPTFYISNSEDVVFDPLQFGSKSAYPDVLVGAIVQHRVLWLIGAMSTEVWYNSGGAGGAGESFPFSLMPSVEIDWGCVAPYSIAKAETAIFWLAQNLNGETVVLRGTGYTVERISTHAIEFQLSTYTTISDCIAYCYMQNGHSFYVMNFPRADKTWVFDLATHLWHERCWTDNNGQDHRHRASCHAFAYHRNIVNDWQNGNLYELDLNSYTDNGQPIKRLIRFPRQIDSDDNHRLSFTSFIAEMDCGETLIPTVPEIGPQGYLGNPKISVEQAPTGFGLGPPGVMGPTGPQGPTSTVTNITSLPTSKDGLAPGSYWNNGGFLSVA